MATMATVFGAVGGDRRSTVLYVAGNSDSGVFDRFEKDVPFQGLEFPIRGFRRVGEFAGVLPMLLTRLEQAGGRYVWFQVVKHCGHLEMHIYGRPGEPVRHRLDMPGAGAVLASIDLDCRDQPPYPEDWWTAIGSTVLEFDHDADYAESVEVGALDSAVAMHIKRMELGCHSPF